MIVPDTNLLLYAAMACSPRHAAAHAWWQDALNGQDRVGLTPVVVTGFVRISTSTRVYSDPLTVSEATAYIRDWLAQPVTSMLTCSVSTVERALDLLADAGTAGNLTTDALIAAHTLEARGTVYSNDTDFGRFEALSWVNPLRQP